ncbi:solute carrier family 52, riboflavin transporter, member 3-B [Trichonephila clavipes]|nr:solute carrier family 52, riboflavin transporter, member 3-B [Trichonephila clavipes]
MTGRQPSLNISQKVPQQNKFPPKEVVCDLYFREVSLIPVSKPTNPAMAENFQSSCDSADFSSSIEKPSSSETNLLTGRPGLPKSHYYLLLFIQGFISTVHNGVLLSIQHSELHLATLANANITIYMIPNLHKHAFFLGWLERLAILAPKKSQKENQ